MIPFNYLLLIEIISEVMAQNSAAHNPKIFVWNTNDKTIPAITIAHVKK